MLPYIPIQEVLPLVGNTSLLGECHMYALISVIGDTFCN
jgi:hypothetical protein